jgi:hypothetical protein
MTGTEADSQVGLHLSSCCRVGGPNRAHDRAERHRSGLPRTKAPALRRSRTGSGGLSDGVALPTATLAT